MHLSGTSVFTPAVPHRQQDITSFLHDSNFSLLHVPRFIIIIIIFLNSEATAKKKFIGAFEGKSFKTSFDFFNFHFK